MITITSISDIIDSYFLWISEIDSPLDGDGYTTIHFNEANRFGIVQAKDTDILRQLSISHLDFCSRVPKNIIADNFDKLCFGLGDISDSSPYLIIDMPRYLEIFGIRKLKKWMKTNLKDDVVILVHNTKIRVSFKSEQDYCLMKLKFS